MNADPLAPMATYDEVYPDEAELTTAREGEPLAPTEPAEPAGSQPGPGIIAGHPEDHQGAQEEPSGAEDLGGDCTGFSMICWREFHKLTERHGLTADERHVLTDLLTLVGPYTTTAEVPGSLTSGRGDGGLADFFGWHREKASELLKALASQRLIAYHFPRGHPGWVAILAYLDFVHVKKPADALAIDSHLARRRDEFAVRAVSSWLAHNAAPPLSEPTGTTPTQRSPAAEATRPSRVVDSEPQRGPAAERPGAMPNLVPSEPGPSPSSSEGSGGGLFPMSPLREVGEAAGNGLSLSASPAAVDEAADSTGSRLCPAIAEATIGDPAEVAVTIRRGCRARRSRSVGKGSKSATYRVEDALPAAPMASPQVTGGEGSAVADAYRLERGRCGSCGRDQFDLDVDGWCNSCNRGRAKAMAVTGAVEHEGHDGPERRERRP